LETTAPRPRGVFSYKVLAAIFGLAITWYVINNIVQPEEGTYDIFELILTLSYPVTAFASFHVAKRYWHSEIFGKAYLSLGLAFLMYFFGDVGYFYQENVMGVEAYPSFADIGYFAFYPFAMYHLLKNSLYFKRKFEMKTKAWISAFPVVMVVSYSILSLSMGGEFNFDFFYGLCFISLNATVLAFAILGAQVFRQSALGPVWGLIVLGMIFYTIADGWYYHLEIFGHYTETHIVNMLWLLNTMIITYALYKHEKVI
jgi:hypothetical protein